MSTSTYQSPYTGQQVDATVSSYISGLRQVTDSATAADIPVLSGGCAYTYTNPISAVSVGSCVSNSIGDLVHFTAVSGGITINMPPGLTVLLQDDITSGGIYDLMVCDNRLIIKEVVEVTQ